MKKKVGKRENLQKVGKKGESPGSEEKSPGSEEKRKAQISFAGRYKPKTHKGFSSGRMPLKHFTTFMTATRSAPE